MAAKRKATKRRSGGKKRRSGGKKKVAAEKNRGKTISSSKKFGIDKLVGDWIPFYNYITKFVFSLTEHLIWRRGFLWIQ